MSDLIVKPLSTVKSDLPKSPYMKKGIINNFPSMLLNIGCSGSGKSTVINYMLTKKNFLKGFYNKIYLFSPTAEIDDLNSHLKLKKEFLITNPTENKLMDIINSQERILKKKGLKYLSQKSKVLIVFDDIISNKKFLNSPPMLKLASMGRHFLISSIINTQSFMNIPRAVRSQSNAMILFPSNNSEVQRVADEITPPKCSKKDMNKLIEYATKNKHDFLFVLMKHPVETRFRKGFKTYLNPVKE